MYFEVFKTRYGQRVWFREFIDHWKQIDDESLEKLSTHLENNEEKDVEGLYLIARLLFDVIYNSWEGTLNSEVIYFATKILVLMGLNTEAQQISRGYSYHSGCCAWRLGSFYRNNTNSEEINELIKQSEILLKQEENVAIKSDLVTWIVAFKSYNELFAWFDENKVYCKGALPYIVYMERLIYNSDIKKAKEILQETDNNYTNTLEEMMVLNKRAVLCQVNGDQKLALEFLEQVQTKANVLGDLLTYSKVSFNQASSYFLIDDYDLSLKFYQQAESSYKSLNDSTGLGKCYSSISSIYMALGEYTIAERYIQLSKQIFSTTHNKIMLDGILYKNAYLLYVKGEYQSALQIMNAFNLKEQSILIFQMSILRITAEFESERRFENKSIAYLYEMAENLSYKMGIALLDLEIARIHALQGNISEAQYKLDLAYKTYQELGNFRGIIRSLLISAFIELLKGNATDAERFCVTALDYSKSNQLFLEEIEAEILLANILFLENYPKRAINILESCMYSLELKGMRNNFYLQAYYAKCNFERIYNPSSGILSKNLVNFIKVAKNTGSLYWIDQSRLLEAQEFLENHDFQNTINITLELIARSQNYEIKFQAKKNYIKGLLGLFNQSKEKEKDAIRCFTSELPNKIQTELTMLKEDLETNALAFHKIETKFLELEFFRIIDKKSMVKTILQSLEQEIVTNNLKYYLNELNEIKESISSVKTKLNVIYLLSG